MTIKIYIAKDSSFDSTEELLFHLEKVLKRSGVRNVTCYDRHRTQPLRPRDSRGNLIKTDELFTDMVLSKRLDVDAEIYELLDEPLIDFKTRCDCGLPINRH